MYYPLLSFKHPCEVYIFVIVSFQTITGPARQITYKCTSSLCKKQIFIDTNIKYAKSFLAFKDFNFQVLKGPRHTVFCSLAKV